MNNINPPPPPEREPSEREVMQLAYAAAKEYLAYWCPEWGFSVPGAKVWVESDSYKALKEAVAALAAPVPAVVEPTAMERFTAMEAECGPDLTDETPIERLRYFCSLAMKGQDWLDVEPFFDALASVTGSEQERT